jgi:hypothetical protein
MFYEHENKQSLLATMNRVYVNFIYNFMLIFSLSLLEYIIFSIKEHYR